jgi:hypothetical protein
MLRPLSLEPGGDLGRAAPRSLSARHDRRFRCGVAHRPGRRRSTFIGEP